MSNIAELLVPAIRWDPSRGYEPERAAIDRALALGVGGFVLMGGSEQDVRALTKDLRQRSKIPLLIAADLERGAGQQFSGTTGLPPLSAIASMNDFDSLRRAAKLTGREARTIGVNWDLAPVCDLDFFPENPVVGTRALGGDPATVGRMAGAWIEACQHEGVLACAKHFPGHGRAAPGVNGDVPTIDIPRRVLLDQDVAPFKAAIASQVASIMVAHAAYPALDASRSPAPLSTQVLRYLLREKLGFDGLIVTDALAQLGDVLASEEATAAVRALDAGCDLLLCPVNLEAILDRLESALRDGPLDDDRILQSRRRRSKWAQWAAPPTEYRKASTSDLAWAAGLADRVVQLLHGERPTLGAAVEVVVVDDDVHDPAPVNPAPFVETLRTPHVRVNVVEAPSEAIRGSVVVLLYGEDHPSKEQTGYSSASLDAVRQACDFARSAGRPSVVVQFSHPRLAAPLNGNENVVCAWSRDVCMQEAAARWLHRAP